MVPSSSDYRSLVPSSSDYRSLVPSSSDYRSLVPSSSGITGPWSLVVVITGLRSLVVVITGPWSQVVVITSLWSLVVVGLQVPARHSQRKVEKGRGCVGECEYYIFITSLYINLWFMYLPKFSRVPKQSFTSLLNSFLSFCLIRK